MILIWKKKIIYYFTPSFRQMFYNKEEKLEIYLDKVKVLANANVYNKKDIKELEFLFNFKDNTNNWRIRMRREETNNAY